jgi:phosphoserine phosphatase
MLEMQNKRAARWHGFCLNFCVGFFVISLTPYVLLLEQFYPRKKRGELWRKKAVWLIRKSYKLNGIQIHAHHSRNVIRTGPAIYAPTHPSEMDGLTMLGYLGPKTILFTAPLAVFPKPLAFWMRKMETVHVRRDPIDDARYPEGNSIPKAIKLAINHLKEGKSLVIFPEGHVEQIHVLHYFHTGPSRISLGSNVPIIPVALINADYVFPKPDHVQPGAIKMSFATPISPPAVKEKDMFPSEKVLNLKHKLEKEIVDLLPLRYLPKYYYLRSKRVGVFVDVDRTIYNGFSQQDLIAYLMFLHKIEFKEAIRVFYWLFLEKLHKLQHTTLMKNSLLLLKGWDVAELQRAINKSFQKKLIENIQYGLYPILKDHAEHKHSVVIVSEVIHPLAKQFKTLIQGRASLDTKLEKVHHHTKACYTGKTPCLCYKENKAKMVADFAQRAGIDLEKSYAYADSGSDIPFMNLVANPMAINPNKELLQYAVEHGWPIMEDAH